MREAPRPLPAAEPRRAGGLVGGLVARLVGGLAGGAALRAGAGLPLARDGGAAFLAGGPFWRAGGAASASGAAGAAAASTEMEARDSTIAPSDPVKSLPGLIDGASGSPARQAALPGWGADTAGKVFIPGRCRIASRA